MKTLHLSIIIGITLVSIVLFSLFIPHTEKQFNIYIEGIHTNAEYAYLPDSSIHTTNIMDSGVNDSSIHISKGTVVALHFINKGKETDAKMDFNIDAFNVHTNQLDYFQSQTITFIANKQGTFTYYSNLHPEMKGTITIDPPNVN